MLRDVHEVLIKIDPVVDGMMASNPLTKLAISRGRYEPRRHYESRCFCPSSAQRSAKHFICYKRSLTTSAFFEGYAMIRQPCGNDFINNAAGTGALRYGR